MTKRDYIADELSQAGLLPPEKPKPKPKPKPKRKRAQNGRQDNYQHLDPPPAAQPQPQTEPQSDPLGLDNLRYQPGDAQWAVVPKKIQKRREQFVQVPWTWLERLAQSQSANTYRVAVTLVFLHWKAKGGPIKLANGMLAMDGVSRSSKWRALTELERFGLITINRRQRKSPIITLVL